MFDLDSCLQPLSFLFCLLFCFDFFEASLGLVLLLLIVDFSICLTLSWETSVFCIGIF